MKIGMFMQPSHPPERSIRAGHEWDLQVLRWADELGFDEALIGQHFTMPWEPLPAPDLTMAIAFEQTERIVLSAGVHNLPFHHPVELAYRIAYLDHIAKGRLFCSVGSGGTPSDWALFNVNGRNGQTQRMMWESVEIMTRLWTEQEPFEYRGEFWSVNFPGPAKERGLGPNLRCFQKPHPRIAVGGASPRSSTLREAGKRGYMPISLALNAATLADHWSSVEAGAAETGRSCSRSDWKVVQHVFLADSDAEAKRLVREGSLARSFNEFFLPYVYGGPERLALIKHDPSVPDEKVDVEYLMDHHWLVGSPDTVVKRLRTLFETTGEFGTLLAGTYDYSDKPEAYRRSMELLAKEVAPRIAGMQGGGSGERPAAVSVSTEPVRSGCPVNHEALAGSVSAKSSVAENDAPRWPFPRDPKRPLDPPPAISELRERCPVSRVTLWDGSNPLVFTKYDDVRAALIHSAASSDTSRPGFPQPTNTLNEMRKNQRSLVRLDPPVHDEHRRMLTAHFTVPHVKSFEGYIETLVDKLLDRMEASEGPVDLVTALAQPVPAAVICKLLDLPQEDADYFQERLETWMSLDVSPEVSWQAATDVHEYFDRVVTDRAKSPGDDLISRLIVTRLNTGQLTRDELLHMLHTLVVGGFDTTANMIALGTITFLNHPEQLEDLRNHPELLSSAVEELLRYLTVTHHTAYRLALTDMDVNGHRIEAGTGFIAPLPAANRDPARFPDPDEFNIRRDARGHVAFGFGVHQCLGQQFARLELQVVFKRLFERFPSLRIDADIESLRFSNALVYGVKSLPVSW